jgi:hypothetical protein
MFPVFDPHGLAAVQNLWSGLRCKYGHAPICSRDINPIENARVQIIDPLAFCRVCGGF